MNDIDQYIKLVIKERKKLKNDILVLLSNNTKLNRENVYLKQYIKKLETRNEIL